MKQAQLLSRLGNDGRNEYGYAFRYSLWLVKRIERYKSRFCPWVAGENIADYGCYQETDSATAQTFL